MKSVFLPQISVIVPVYNVEKYLHRCVESILSQTLDDFELILVDDGSKDNSGTICDEYARKDFRVKVFHKKNSGLSAARNTGLEKALGKYVIFVDSDDYWADVNCLDYLYKLIEEFDADVIRGEYIALNEKGEEINTIARNKKVFEYKLLDSATFYINAIAGENFSWLYLYKKKAIEQFRFDENRAFQEDIDFNIKFFSKPHKCIYTSKKFYVYQKREASITTTLNINNLSGSFSLCDVFDKYVDLTTDIILKSCYRYNSIMMYYWTLETLSSDPYYANHPSIIKELSLCERQKQVAGWARKDRTHYPFYIYINPHIATKILRIELLIKGTILKYGSKCKRTVYKWIKK